jgi:hypothetical protein
MKPKPFSALNHLTVPCGIPVLPLTCDADPTGTVPVGGCAGAARRRNLHIVEPTVTSPAPPASSDDPLISRTEEGSLSTVA